VEEFRSQMMQIAGDTASLLSPVDFAGRVSEAQLESWLVKNPELCGEQLLVLGSQLAEFADDKDRLDVLALDKRGEVVLLELKVDGAFRLTDLQALAYAAGYSSVGTDHFADILRRRLEKTTEGDVSIEDAKSQIVAFVDVLDDFAEWQPSKRVRIKLVAPGYPKRVLHTVKWLGDVYGMPIEAIEVQLFEDTHGHFQITFDRLLPLKSDDAFDLTIKQAEEQIAGLHKPKKPAILKTLLEHGIVAHDDELWFHPNGMNAEDRQLFTADNDAFRVRLDTSGGRPMFRWRPRNDAPEELLSPSLAWFSILGAVLPGRYSTPSHAPVFNQYSIEPAGPTLGDVGFGAGVW
jgi:hypothetical protein